MSVGVGGLFVRRKLSYGRKVFARSTVAPFPSYALWFGEIWPLVFGHAILGERGLGAGNAICIIYFLLGVRFLAFLYTFPSIKL